MSSDNELVAVDESEASQLLAVAKEVTAIASRHVSTHTPQTLTWKGDRDVTSDVDISTERLVKGLLHKHTPHAGFLGEEEGGGQPPNGIHWVFDPIDGTVNYVHGFPLYAISLSLIRDGKPFVAVIDLPFFRTQYSALRGAGSYVNGERLQASTTSRLDAALVSIDQYTFDENTQQTNEVRHRLIRHLYSEVQRIRMLGTSAIDLAWTAQGRLDACIVLGNKTWDTSAGVLVAQEAGVRVIDLDGSDHTSKSSATVAITPALEDSLMSIVQATLADIPSS